MELKFIHRVSKGTRFNQIYIPLEMSNHFQSGDLVEVTLLEKKSPIYYSSKLIKPNEFKENLIKNIFLELGKYKEISQVFIIGSFLTQKQDYNDIDIIIISDKGLEEEVYKNLVDKFELKFHVISIPKDKFENLQNYCPLTRSMLYYFVSNHGFKLPKETQINKDHIMFLLMMPEDILKISMNSRIYYDSIRRLITIERFLKNQSLDPIEINNQVKSLVSQEVFMSIKQNQNIDEQTIKKIRSIIKIKLKNIKKGLIKK
jgi:hypothetical protein